MRQLLRSDKPLCWEGGCTEEEIIKESWKHKGKERVTNREAENIGGQRNEKRERN
jgi:hypothetical protein